MRSLIWAFVAHISHKSISHDEAQFYITDVQRRKRTLKPSAGNEVPDQTAHLRSLIRDFVAQLKNLLQNISINREGPDQNVQIRRLILAFSIHKCLRALCMR